MKHLKRILYATDFQPASKAAAAHVAALARRFDSSIDLIHVVEGSDHSPEYRSRVTRSAHSALQELVGHMTAEHAFVDRVVVKHGDAFAEVIQQADELDANVIVVGAGNTVDERGKLVTGVQVERLIRKAHKPVWVVHPERPQVPQNIVCPLDLSPSSGRALTNAIDLAAMFDAKLTILAVGNLSEGEEDGVPAGSHASFTHDVDAFISEFDFHGVEADRLVRWGSPHQHILDVCQQLDADLLVMGARGRSPIVRLLMGSTAVRVARNLPCSVVMVKAEDVLRLDVESAIDQVLSEYGRGLSLLGAGKAAEALEALDHCVSFDVTFAPAWDAMAEAHDQLGQIDKATRCRQLSAAIHNRAPELSLN